MANQNSNGFLAKFAKLPLATKIISLVCVVVIVAGSATAAVLLSSPETSGNISSGGETSGINSVGGVASDSDDDDVVVSSDTSTGGESSDAGTASQPTSSSSVPTQNGNSSASGVAGKNETVTSKPASTPSATSTPAPVTSTPVPVTSTPAATNEFFNPNNYADMLNSGGVNIKPRWVYWKDGYLHAECFVINGMNNPVRDIRVDHLRFYNASGTMAQAGFGTVGPNNNFNGTIGAHSYIVWTFSFAPDCISNYGASLSPLGCEADTRYAH